jgi:hypothetical protein
MVPERQRPHPWRSYRRCIGLEDAPDNFAVGEHVEIVVIPVARGTAKCSALQKEVVFVHDRLSFRRHSRHVELAIIEQGDFDLPAERTDIGLR